MARGLYIAPRQPNRDFVSSAQQSLQGAGALYGRMEPERKYKPPGKTIGGGIQSGVGAGLAGMQLGPSVAKGLGLGAGGGGMPAAAAAPGGPGVVASYGPSSTGVLPYATTAELMTPAAAGAGTGMGAGAMGGGATGAGVGMGAGVVAGDAALMGGTAGAATGAATTTAATTVGSSVAAGTTTGSAAGPWGAAIGAAIGLAAYYLS